MNSTTPASFRTISPPFLSHRFKLQLLRSISSPKSARSCSSYSSSFPSHPRSPRPVLWRPDRREASCSSGGVGGADVAAASLGLAGTRVVSHGEGAGGAEAHGQEVHGPSGDVRERRRHQEAEHQEQGLDRGVRGADDAAATAQQRAQEPTHWPQPPPPPDHPVSMAWGYFPESRQDPQLAGKCYEGGINTSMHCVTERTIIKTPPLGPGAFAAMVPWESGRDMKERMRRYARTVHAFALVRDCGAGFVDGEGRVRFTPSRKDMDELRNGLHRVLRTWRKKKTRWKKKCGSHWS